MTKIKVTCRATRRGVVLDANQVFMVENELARVLPYAAPVDDLLVRVAPDFEMVVAGTGQPVHYEVYARSVLVDVGKKTMTQFYMGLAVMEWLYK